MAVKPALLIALLITLGCAAWGLFERRVIQQDEAALAAATAQSAHLRQQADELREQLTTVKHQLDETVKQKLPLTVAFQSSRYGSGLVAVFRNNSPEPLTISVAISDPITHRRRESNFSIDANGLQTIGDSQGWVFSPGQSLQITSSQFGTTEYVVPEPEAKK
jgi:hypothetical protein